MHTPVGEKSDHLVKFAEQKKIVYHIYSVHHATWPFPTTCFMFVFCMHAHVQGCRGTCVKVGEQSGKVDYLLLPCVFWIYNSAFFRKLLIKKSCVCVCVFAHVQYLYMCVFICVNACSCHDTHMQKAEHTLGGSPNLLPCLTPSQLLVPLCTPS